MTNDPRRYVCPACNAQAGKPCSQPTDDSRKTVCWYHVSREAEAVEAERCER
jgi:hypothetical protein